MVCWVRLGSRSSHYNIVETMSLYVVFFFFYFLLQGYDFREAIRDSAAIHALNLRLPPWLFCIFCFFLSSSPTSYYHYILYTRIKFTQITRVLRYKWQYHGFIHARKSKIIYLYLLVYYIYLQHVRAYYMRIRMDNHFENQFPLYYYGLG